MGRHSARSSLVVIVAVSPVNRRRPGCHFLLIIIMIIIIIIGTRLNGKWPCAGIRLNLETENRCVILTVMRITRRNGWPGVYIIIIRDRTSRRLLHHAG